MSRRYVILGAICALMLALSATATYVARDALHQVTEVKREIIFEGMCAKQTTHECVSKLIKEMSPNQRKLFQGAPGQRGPRGPAGARGPQGGRGRTGAQGQRGSRGGSPAGSTSTRSPHRAHGAH